MVPSLISFDREYRSRPFQVMKTEIGRLKLLDGQPGDLNKNQKAIGADLFKDNELTVQGGSAPPASGKGIAGSTQVRLPTPPKFKKATGPVSPA